MNDKAEMMGDPRAARIVQFVPRATKAFLRVCEMNLPAMQTIGLIAAHMADTDKEAEQRGFNAGLEASAELSDDEAAAWETGGEPGVAYSFCQKAATIRALKQEPE